MAIAALVITCTAGTAAIAAFVRYVVLLRKNPGYRFLQTNADIESSSWLLILTAIVAIAGASALIANFRCGPECPSATLTCNTNCGTMGAAVVTAVSVLSAALFKHAALHQQAGMAKSAKKAAMARASGGPLSEANTVIIETHPNNNIIV